MFYFYSKPFMWEDKTLIQTFWDEKLHHESGGNMALAAYVKDMDRIFIFVCLFSLWIANPFLVFIVQINNFILIM